MIRSAKALAVATAVAALGVVAPATSAHAVPGFDVKVVTANGSGCPASTATAAVNRDGTFTIDFDGYYAWSGGEAPPTDFRRNCQFALEISHASGGTYAVESARYSGFVLLNDGASAVQTARYYHQGQSTTLSGSHTFTGPAAETYDTVDRFAPAQQDFAPCDADRLLNINTDLRLTPQPGAETFNALILEGSITVDLAWKRCA